ncbi:MAG: Mini-ribonuclease 3, partial [Clostridia bacterium]|nr:Mini-ribonuclease 3 [Clostridia bacterium]
MDQNQINTEASSRCSKVRVPISAMNPIVLAYIGDGIYELLVRKKMVENYPNDKIQSLHKKTVSFAKASSQAKVVRTLREEDFFTEEEWAWVKRGRNQQSIPPKNAVMSEYRYATGFETL